MTQTVQYGMRELRGLYQKYASIGLTTAIVIHLAVIGGYYLYGYLQEEEIPMVMVRITKYSELGPPPSMTDASAAPAVSVAADVVKPSVGIPVPVPDAEINPEQTIQTQQEMSAAPSPVAAMDNAGGGVQVEQDVKVEVDEEPPDFVPVEKQPVPVKQISPEYPEIAKRAGVQGTVWVKCLVDKEGKVKKAVIMKSDAEIFNDPAIAAALQWVFTPAIMNNGPVAVWAAIPFRFTLNK